MFKLYYQPQCRWFGDCMPFGRGEKFYLYHQRDSRKPCPCGEPFGWHLSTTSDFVAYEDLGVAIPRGGDEEQDQYIFAGSVLEAQDGSFHAFYTGYNRDYPQLGKASQVVMHAVSDDLKQWKKNALAFPPQEGYDPDDWRDPFVLWDEEGFRYVLLLGARREGPKTRLSGCTVWYTSRDLDTWEFQGDFWAPGLYTMHEMPDLFRIGDWWYHVISEYSDRNRTVYRMGKSITRPWFKPEDDCFDGRAYYAGRTFCLGNRRILFGWVPTKEDCDDTKNFEWAGTFVPHELFQRPDGTLGVKPPETVRAAFAEGARIPDSTACREDGRTLSVLSRGCGDFFKFEADLSFEEGTVFFGLGFCGDSGTESFYQFRFLCGENRFLFEKSPNIPWYACMNLGLERPITLVPGEKYHVVLLVDGSIATLYVDGVAMNARMYQKEGEELCLFVSGGSAAVENAVISRELKN